MSGAEKVYKDYDQDQLDMQYNNRERVINHIDIMDSLAKRGTIYANSITYHKDIAFGEDPDEVLDVYPATNGDPNAPVMIYFHGGFCIRGTKTISGLSHPGLTMPGQLSLL